MSVKQLLHRAAGRLSAAGIDAPAYEARLLVAAVAATDQAGLLRYPDRPIDPADLEPLLARRCAREPLAYILGHAEFWTLKLAVSPATLIPRADSETLIEAALHARSERGSVQSILDLGTGTGCLLLAALSEFPSAFGIGTDRALAACSLAAANAQASDLSGRCAFLCADWADPLHAQFDLILSNPPYIPRPEIAALMPEVARFEPAAALDGGPDGLTAYRALLLQMPRLLAPRGVAVLELGAGQATQVGLLAAQAGYRATTRADLAGHARALILHQP